MSHYTAYKVNVHELIFVKMGRFNPNRAPDFPISYKAYKLFGVWVFKKVAG